MRLGLSARPVSGEVLYLMAADDLPDGVQLPARQFTVVHAAYQTAWTETADVVFPGLMWAEKTGHVTNLEGRTLEVRPLIESPPVNCCRWAVIGGEKFCPAKSAWSL